MPASELLLTIISNTKVEELWIVKEFLSRLDYSTDVISSSESPDFEINLRGNSIGVEVTKYYADFEKNGSQAQKDFNEWIIFSKKLKTRLKQTDQDFDTFYGAVHFKSGRILYKNLLTNEAIEEFIFLLREHSSIDNEGISVSISKDAFPVLSEYIETIYLRNLFPETKYLWWNGRLQSGRIIESNSALTNIIEKKEIMSNKYKSGYFQQWLIIYAGGLGLHDIYPRLSGKAIRQGKIIVESDQPQDSISEMKTITSSYFTHIFIWDKFTEKIYQLYPYPKKLFDYGERKIYVNHLPLR